jgi:hypothetical protein
MTLPADNQALDLGTEPLPPENKPVPPAESKAFINLGSEPIESKKSLHIETEEDVSDKDIFKLAKVILLFCGLAYILIAVLKIFSPVSEAVDEVWDHATVFLTSIISLVLGLYFGQKKEK